MQGALTADNYSRGFLLDEELMAGISRDPGNSTRFVGFVVRHTTGEVLSYGGYPSLEAALRDINAIERNWVFESSSACGSGCDPERCGVESCNPAACPQGSLG